MDSVLPSAVGNQMIILDSITEGVFTVDMKWHITSFNRAAEKITGVPRDEAVGRLCYEVFKANVCESGCVLRQTLESGHEIVNRTVNIIAADGRAVPISVSTALLKNDDGDVIGGVGRERSGRG